jgi:hypothetical protein
MQAGCCLRMMHQHGGCRRLPHLAPPQTFLRNPTPLPPQALATWMPKATWRTSCASAAATVGRVWAGSARSEPLAVPQPLTGCGWGLRRPTPYPCPSLYCRPALPSRPVRPALFFPTPQPAFLPATCATPPPPPTHTHAPPLTPSFLLPPARSQGGSAQPALPGGGLQRRRGSLHRPGELAVGGTGGTGGRAVREVQGTGGAGGTGGSPHHSSTWQLFRGRPEPPSHAARPWPGRPEPEFSSLQPSHPRMLTQLASFMPYGAWRFKHILISHPLAPLNA